MAMLDDVRPRPDLPRRRRDPPEGPGPGRRGVSHHADARSWRNGAAESVSFDDAYRDLPSLTRLISMPTSSILPYDSDDQVTSGVLVDAVASGRPVIATAFPHAVELLGGGAGVVVPQRDAAAIADVVRSVIEHPERLAQMAAECRRLAPELSWPAVARRYDELAGSLVGGGDQHVNVPEPSFEHLAAMSDDIGTFEHADHSAPRDGGGLLRRRHRSCARRHLPRALRRRNRRSICAGSPTGSSSTPRPRTGASAIAARLTGAGTAVTPWTTAGADRCGRSAPPRAGRRRSGCATRRRRRSSEALDQRTPWPRSMAFAALGAAEVLVVAPGPRRPRAGCSPMPSTPSGGPAPTRRGCGPRPA